MTAFYLRDTVAHLIPTQYTEDLPLGTWELLRGLGRGLPRLHWDNEDGIGRGKRNAEGVDAFMGTLAVTLVMLLPGDPE
ncbi:hypothetical protein [Ferrimicrobium acidiphilum]|uniref:hypothetical protein n=1 Tax=Ferrimicrobium acidiphilum TaxID=121039 RepID=UPI0023F1F13E|nr:hypothetical protein [Ferrimicrobium acidiphilum]